MRPDPVHRRDGLLTRLLRDQRASTSALMVAGFIPVLLAIGGGVDLGRVYVVKSQLQTAVDAAALAAAQSCKTVTTSGTATADVSIAEPQATAYFDENFPDGYMGTTARDLDMVELCGGAALRRVSLTGTADMPWSFMKLTGQGGKVITASAVADSGGAATVEAVLVLDITGSMANNTTGANPVRRDTALRAAAHDFLDIIYQNGETRADVAIGMVPYNVAVNLGTWGTSRLGTTVQNMDGYTNQAAPYRWTGCVKNDPSVTNMSADVKTQDPGAWDIRKDIAGFNGTSAPLLVPMLHHPTWVRKSMTATQADYYRPKDYTHGLLEDNRYQFTGTAAQKQTLANTVAYKNFFYGQYIGLNNGAANNADDVVRAIGGGYYNPVNGPDGTYVIQYDKIPNLNDTNHFKPVAAYTTASNITTNRANARGPNLICPVPIEPIAYGKTRSAHKTWITNNVNAWTPAGTIHHVGMLWGYRMLQNTAAFPRTKPATITKPAKRALLFMTDGLYEFANFTNPVPSATTKQGWADSLYSAYGRVRDLAILSTNDADAMKTASGLRFEKICSAATSEGVAVYVIALQVEDPASDAMFTRCAPGNKYRSVATQAELREAFQEIARDITDLHLVQ